MIECSKTTLSVKEYEREGERERESDPNWINIFFSSISMHLEWKKLRNKLLGSFLLAGPSLAKQGLKPSGSVLRHETIFFWGKTLPLMRSTFSCYSTHIKLSTVARIVSIGVCMQNLCHSKVDLPIFTPIVREDAAPAPIIHGKRG